MGRVDKSKNQGHFSLIYLPPPPSIHSEQKNKLSWQLVTFLTGANGQWHNGRRCAGVGCLPLCAGQDFHPESCSSTQRPEEGPAKDVSQITSNGRSFSLFGTSRMYGPVKLNAGADRPSKARWQAFRDGFVGWQSDLPIQVYLNLSEFKCFRPKTQEDSSEEWREIVFLLFVMSTCPLG